MLGEGFPGSNSVKEPGCQCRRCKRLEFQPWGRKLPWRGKWQPSPVFLPGKSHGQRSLAGYSPWGRKRVGHNLSTEHAHSLDPSPYPHLLHSSWAIRGTVCFLQRVWGKSASSHWFTRWERKQAGNDLVVLLYSQKAAQCLSNSRGGTACEWSGWVEGWKDAWIQGGKSETYKQAESFHCDWTLKHLLTSGL